MSEIIDFDRIENAWKKNTYPTMLYINSPFCKSVCDYCVYRGRITDNTFDDFFNRHLPSEYDKYSGIIESQNIKEIYFGGGTPNYVSDLSNLNPIFEKIRHLKPQEKTIELHFNLPITDETIDKLIEEKFNTVILCIQTFNRELLKKHGRVNTRCNNLEYLIKRFHDAGIRVGSDFIFFVTDDEGLDAIKSDIDVVENLKNKLDEITISPVYQSKNEERNAYVASNLEEIIKDLLFSNNMYIRDWVEMTNTPVSIEHRIHKYNGIRLFNKEAIKNKNFYQFVSYLNESFISLPDELDSKYYEMETSVIGIGSYHNQDKNVYSRCCNNFMYYEIYDGKSLLYNLISEKNFYDKARDLIDWLERISNGQEPDIGTNLTIFNQRYLIDRNTNVKDCNIDFTISHPIKETDYILNVKNHLKDYN